MKMPELSQVLFTLVGVLFLTIFVQGQDQSGFTSLDCGITANSTYNDANTTILYVSDASFVDTGVTKSISNGIKSSHLARQLWNLRTFPNGLRNCYKLPLTTETNYLIRATFYYGNYDGLNTSPIFDLHLGVNKWDTVEIANATLSVSREIIYTSTTDYVYVCLVNTGKGTPFISALEVRPLKNTTYKVDPGLALAIYLRWDLGSITNLVVRYPDDVYDRLWVPSHFQLWTDISTNQTIDAGQNDYQPPSKVMQTADVPTNASQPMGFYIDTTDSSLEFYAYFHFAEIVKLGPKQSRIFNITEDNSTWYGPVIPDYLSTSTVLSGYPLTGGTYIFHLIKVGGSTLPPLLNALEIYFLVNLAQLQTLQADVDAITSIKSTYAITRNWQGDPCAPQDYAWNGLNCSYLANDPPIITALDLSSSGLMGSISSDIGSLKSLESLNLSNNSLSGSVPSFLSQLTSLKILDLSGNNLTGTIPVDLYQRSQNGLLKLSVSGNPNLCTSVSCTPTTVEDKKKKKSVVGPVVGSVVGVLVLAAALAVLFVFLRKGNRQASAGANGQVMSRMTDDAKQRRYTYADLRQMTNNFEKVIGKGGFGTVYYGYLDGTHVAVKLLSESSVQGFKEFQTEVKLLLRVHHKNLTTLVGYCDESSNLGLIYEYMANGNLQDHLSGKKSNTLSWEGRLQVAVEAAQGLEYLHNGCKPPIVHRDVKTTNILLNDKFQAKIADFGLSRVFPTEVGAHVSTVVAGTPGYLDPEYYVTNWLTEKSDVYSFGVVLLEIVTARSVVDKAGDYGHLSQWVSSLVEKGDINQVVDPRLRGKFDVNSVWKVVELALACLSTPSAKRPTMNQVVIELNQAWASESAPTKEGFTTIDHDHMTVQVNSTVAPLAR